MSSLVSLGLGEVRHVGEGFEKVEGPRGLDVFQEGGGEGGSGGEVVGEEMEVTRFENDLMRGGKEVSSTLRKG